MLATMIGIIFACKPVAENSSQFDQNKVYQKELKSFYEKQCSLWNKFNTKSFTRTGDLNSVIGYDEFENDEFEEEEKEKEEVSDEEIEPIVQNKKKSLFFRVFAKLK